MVVTDASVGFPLRGPRTILREPQDERVLEQKRALTRHDKILDAALRVFAKKGYREAAVDDIAVESKTSKGGVYFHFPGKQAIFLELLNRSAIRLRAKT